MAMNESCHKEQEYLWFRGRDLNSFCKAFYEVKGVGIPSGESRGTQCLGHLMCLFITNKNIYGLGMGI